MRPGVPIAVGDSTTTHPTQKGSARDSWFVSRAVGLAHVLRDAVGPQRLPLGSAPLGSARPTTMPEAEPSAASPGPASTGTAPVFADLRQPLAGRPVQRRRRTSCQGVRLSEVIDSKTRSPYSVSGRTLVAQAQGQPQPHGRASGTSESNATRHQGRYSPSRCAWRRRPLDAPSFITKGLSASNARSIPLCWSSAPHRMRPAEWLLLTANSFKLDQRGRWATVCRPATASA